MQNWRGTAKRRRVQLLAVRRLQAVVSIGAFLCAATWTMDSAGSRPVQRPRFAFPGWGATSAPAWACSPSPRRAHHMSCRGQHELRHRLHGVPQFTFAVDAYVTLWEELQPAPGEVRLRVRRRAQQTAAASSTRRPSTEEVETPAVQLAFGVEYTADPRPRHPAGLRLRHQPDQPGLPTRDGCLTATAT